MQEVYGKSTGQYLSSNCNYSLKKLRIVTVIYCHLILIDLPKKTVNCYCHLICNCRLKKKTSVRLCICADGTFSLPTIKSCTVPSIFHTVASDLSNSFFGSHPKPYGHKRIRWVSRLSKASFHRSRNYLVEQLNVEAATTAREIDKELGMLKLRRVLPSGTHGPFSRCVDFCGENELAPCCLGERQSCERGLSSPSAKA